VTGVQTCALPISLSIPAKHSWGRFHECLAGRLSACSRACAREQALSIPAKHSWGRFHAASESLAAMHARGQVVLRYREGHNFNGSLQSIAGVCNEAGNVFGLMPHPEHAVDELTGSSDGLCLFESMRLAVEEGWRAGVGAAESAA